MKQSTLPAGLPAGLHVAIIMDGNGRWANARGKRREWGHRQGAKAVRRVVEAAPDEGISTLTLYAFSADNWNRPTREVGLLMKLLRRYLRTEIQELRENGVRLHVVGRRDRLDPDLVSVIESAEARTAGGTRLDLRLAIDYSSRDMLVRALKNGAGLSELEREQVAHLLGHAMNQSEPSPDVDLLIRTGGEQRLSDFLLWEAAYAELYFTPRMWPDFTARDLDAALREFHARDRRFGKIAVAV